MISHEVEINIKCSEHTGKVTKYYLESWGRINMEDNVEGRSIFMWGLRCTSHCSRLGSIALKKFSHYPPQASSLTEDTDQKTSKQAKPTQTCAMISIMGKIRG